MVPLRILVAAGLLGSVASAQALCIRSGDILATARPDDRTIVFTLQNKSVCRNDLPVGCPGLKTIVGGFPCQSTNPAADAPCDGMVVHLHNMGHASCMAGDCTRLR